MCFDLAAELRTASTCDHEATKPSNPPDSCLRSSCVATRRHLSRFWGNCMLGAGRLGAGWLAGWLVAGWWLVGGWLVAGRAGRFGFGGSLDSEPRSSRRADGNVSSLCKSQFEKKI